MGTADWSSEARAFIQRSAAGDRQLEEYAEANLNTCVDLVAGRDIYSGKDDRDSGARMVVNISSVHIPAFCEASRKGDKRPYKNGYDLGKFRLGSRPPSSEPNLREIVDAALPLNGARPEDVYFGAVELFGSGIRFYGDVCLVIRKQVIAANTLILDRNSFDLISAPIRDRINRSSSTDKARAEEAKNLAGPWKNGATAAVRIMQMLGLTRQRHASDQAPQAELSADKARAEEAKKLAGRWKKDTGAMAALRVMQILGLRRRRYTSGQIAETIRQDEDYIEVIKKDSFGADVLQEARLSANDAAYDSFTAERTAYGPSPRLESLMWRDRRRVAEQELRREGVTVRVVTSSGRSRD
ncbi:hypothetical protein [Bradyrhizobium quebecense]|uniref:Uncharacterized protein n=2 Tax=Bradyrhizobium quebecense TaxID=2748629 RepID=A0ABS3MTR4_9BRAD|nr:hypothetical protein [Bradyrhizobium quebecense]UGY02523.1 hypothetical protein J4P68_0036490 [Bradyrhizobium quebecense]